MEDCLNQKMRTTPWFTHLLKLGSALKCPKWYSPTPHTYVYVLYITLYRSSLFYVSQLCMCLNVLIHAEIDYFKFKL